MMTEQEMNVLAQFSKQHGNRWKKTLREMWQSGDYCGERDCELLQSLRNSQHFGPNGLMRYRSRE